METLGWYDNPDYSDLAILLSDGCKIHVHKIVLCTNNGYFKKACGVGSQFAERYLSVIELKEDKPEAVDYVLRRIYKNSISVQIENKRSWRHWLDVYVAADKYLEPGINSEAHKHIFDIARSLKNIGDIFEVFETLDTQTTGYPTFVALAAELQKTHLDGLIKYDRSRRHVEKECDTMWKIVDSLYAAKNGTSRPSIHSKSSPRLIPGRPVEVKKYCPVLRKRV